MKSAHIIIARSDALYGGVAMGATILELALIASNPSLGQFSLEFSLVTQLIISLIVEFYIGHYFTNKLGIANTTIYGFIFKLACATFLTLGFWAALLGYWHIGWSLILIAFVCDSAGTGCLKASFRPAYNALHIKMTGHGADYVKAFNHHLYIRIGTPFILLLAASLIINYASYLYAILAIMSILLFLRFVQIYISNSDLRPTKTRITISTPLNRHAYLKHFTVAAKYPVQIIGYVAGNVFESLILMYAIGLLYRHRDLLGVAQQLSWLGSSAIAYLVFLASTVLGRLVISKFIIRNSSTTFGASCLIATTITSLLLASTSKDITYFLSLAFFCLLGVVIGTIITRLTSNEVLHNASDSDAVSFFLVSELGTTLTIILITTASSFTLKPERIIEGLSYGLIVLMGAYCLAIMLIRATTETSK
ncbi:hypothetical protein D3C84_333270 [compost metagenome]